MGRFDYRQNRDKLIPSERPDSFRPSASAGTRRSHLSGGPAEATRRKTGEYVPVEQFAAYFGYKVAA